MPETSARGEARGFGTSRSARPASSEAGETNDIDVTRGAPRPYRSPNRAVNGPGCGVGIDAFASHMAAPATKPALETACG